MGGLRGAAAGIAGFVFHGGVIEEDGEVVAVPSPESGDSGADGVFDAGAGAPLLGCPVAAVFDDAGVESAGAVEGEHEGGAHLRHGIFGEGSIKVGAGIEEGEGFRVHCGGGRFFRGVYG